MPIHVTCPHCNEAIDMADESAGQMGSCSHCGKAFAVPLDGGDVPPKRGPARWLTWFTVLIVCLFVVMLSGLLLPAVNAPREPVRRQQCRRNLRQIGLAMLSYQQKYGCFPPAFIPDKDGKPKHSWRVLILPFLEQENLYREYRFNEPWNGPHNKELAARMPEVYRCPSESSRGTSQTSYAMIVGPHAISDGPTPRKMSDIKDGLSNTIMVAECAGAGINWLEPRDLNAEKITKDGIGNLDSQKPPGGINSCHSGFANVLFCEGRVWAISGSVDEKVLRAILTIDGGESVDMDDVQ
jgi:hypothetical protein